MKILSKTVTYRAPQPGITAYERTHYTRRSELEKIRFRFLDISDDVFDNHLVSFSDDNGKTWPESLPVRTAQKTSLGTLRRFEDAIFIDPVNGRLLNTYCEAYLEHNVASEGFSTHALKYRVSEDGGKSSIVDERVIGMGYTAEHPFDCVWIGKNAFVNAAPNSIVRAPQGHLLLATTITVLGTDGSLYNPGGGYGWFEVIVLVGRWQPDARIAWELTARLASSPGKSTRGLFEPTIALLPDGHVLMVMRGSNGWAADPECKLPSHKWYSVSADGGFTWSEPAPWRYADGTSFFSPSSISQLLWHSNGKLYWFSNISRKNCCGNGPRYPLYVGEVDPVNRMLNPDSMFVIADRQPGQHDIQFSNFNAHEDRASGNFVLHMSHYEEQQKGVWGGDAYEYRIEP